MSTTSGEPRRRRRWPRVLLRVGRVLALVVAGVVVLVLAVLALTPTREFLLRRGLAFADGKLPGELSWRRAAWPRPGRLELDDLLWTDRAETLAAAGRLRLQVQVPPLVAGEIVVDSVVVARTFLDVARIQAALVDTAAAPRRAPADTAARRRLPNLALGALAVRDLRALAPTGAAIHVRDLDAALELREGHERGGALAARASLGDSLTAAWRLVGHWQDGLAVEFSPLSITGALPPPAREMPLTGRLILPCVEPDSLRRCWRDLTLDNLTLTGDLGEASISAHLAGADTGRVDASLALVRPPAPVARALASFAPDTLRQRVLWALTGGWPAEDPHLELRADVAPPALGRPWREAGVAAHATFALPGPSDLAALLPDTLDTRDLGAVVGRLDGRWDGGVVPPAFAVDLDLTGTRWLAAGRLRAHGRGRAVTVEELALAMEGLRVAASGAADSARVDLTAEVALADLDLVRRWPGLLPARAQGHGDLRLAVRGDLPLPDAEVTLRGGYASPQVTVPALALDLTHRGRRLDLRLSAPEGVATSARAIDVVALELAADLASYPDSARGRLSGRVAADTSSFAVAADLAIARRGERQVALWARVDTLAARSGRRALTLDQPFSLAFDPGDTSVTVDGLRFEGRYGFARVDARLRRDVVSADLALDLGVPLDEVRPLLPPAQQAALPSGTAVLSGEVRLRGSPAAPQGSASLAMGLRDVPDRPAVALRGTAWLLPGGPLAPDVALGAAPPDAPRRGLAADLELTVEGEPVLDVTARVPAAVSLRPAALAPGDDPALIALRGDGIPLARLSALLPRTMTLGGRLDVDLRAEGPLRTMGLDGRLAASGVRLELVDGSWLTAGGSVVAGGSVQAPDLEGSIDITAGVLQVPETPPDLLPAEGSALLWPQTTRGDTATAAIDTTAARVAAAGAAADSAAAQAAATRAALHVTSPGNLWIRGRGLDVELEGDIWVNLAGGATSLTGDLSAVRGTLSLLGRNFTLETGKVYVAGEAPELDLQMEIRLTTTLESTQFWVTVTGSPTNLELALTSEPEMSEGDIMAFLIFGKPVEELDEGQTDLVAQRSADIAAAYGAQQLQEVVASQLGLDLVRIEPHTEDASATKLTVGKYLSPKVMVSYEQALESVSTFVVHLEYLIKGGLKVHSAVSQGEHSGAEILWSKDY